MDELFQKSIEDLSRFYKFSEEELKILNEADMAAEELVMPEYEHYMNHEFDGEAPNILAKHNLLGLPIKKEYGGLEVHQIVTTLAKERLGQLGMGISSFINVQVFLCAQAIQRWGSDEQKKKYLPEMVKKEKIFCFGLTEPEAGSDPASLKTEYSRNGSSYLLSGTKYLISNGTISDYMIAFARSKENPKEISAFIVDMHAEGVERTQLKEKIGLFTSDTGMIDINNVEVPSENVLGPMGKGMPIAYSSLLNARLGVAAGCVGVIEASLKASLSRAKERIQHGKQIGKHQLIQQHISIIRQNLEASRWPIFHAAMLNDDYIKSNNDKALLEKLDLHSSLAKRIASRLAFDSADRAVQIHGGFGYSLMSPVGQLFGDSRVARIYEGTDEIQDLKIASELLGKDFEAYR